jgi:lincosamide nucleotidyltransferase A/C/D/E
MRRMHEGCGLVSTSSRVLVKDARGKALDLHPLAFQTSGEALQANIEDLPPFRYPSDEFVHGTIGGHRVQCIGRDLQVRFHSGYELDAKARHDLEQLRNLKAR